MLKRINSLNSFVLVIIVVYTIFTQRWLALSNLDHRLSMILLFISSVGAYRLLISIVYWIVGKSGILLRMYWGRQYIAGIWTYFYTKSGVAGEDKQYFFGVWRFEQDLFTTKVIGFGLSETFEVRSRVDSVADMFEVKNHYEVLNERRDSITPEKTFFSVTSMMFNDYKRLGLLKHATTILAQTTIYGGLLNGEIHNDKLTRHPEFQTESEAIEYLKKQVAERKQSALPKK